MARAAYNPQLPGPERLLPGWNAARSGRESLLAQLLEQLTEAATPLWTELEDAAACRWLETVPLGEDRLLWTARCPYGAEEDLKVTVVTSQGSLLPRRALSGSDFAFATDPVYHLDPLSGTLELRNLAVREQEVLGTGSYTVTGEAPGFVPDQDLYWLAGLTDPWQHLPAGSSQLSGTTLTLPVTGQITVRYGSAATLALLATGSVLLESPSRKGTPLPLVLRPPDNLFDGWGAVLGIPRLHGEDNGSYRARLLALTQSPPESSRAGVIRQLAAHLGLAGWTTWNGLGTLTLDGSATEQIRAALLVGEARQLRVEEELKPRPGALPANLFYASYGVWKPGYQVFVDGVPRQAAVSGNLVTLPESTSGRVTASYSVDRYVWSYHPDGSIHTLAAGQGLASGSYQVLYFKEVEVHPADLEAVREALLITAGGLPTALCFELYRALQAESRVTLGRAGWGGGYWRLPEEAGEGVAQLPVALDRHLT